MTLDDLELLHVVYVSYCTTCGRKGLHEGGFE